VDAKLFYEKVISDYPKSPEAKIAQKKLALFKK
jgi:TolA-binding protein